MTSLQPLKSNERLGLSVLESLLSNQCLQKNLNLGKLHDVVIKMTRPVCPFLMFKKLYCGCDCSWFLQAGDHIVSDVLSARPNFHSLSKFFFQPVSDYTESARQVQQYFVEHIEKHFPQYEELAGSILPPDEVMNTNMIKKHIKEQEAVVHIS